jgi:Spy/CpxP family protein refolding chaperone
MPRVLLEWSPAYLAIVLALGVSSPAIGQTAGPPDEPTRPLEVLLQQRESLGLTPEQLGRIEEIRRDLTALNEPLVERMMTLRAQWQQARRAMRRADTPEIAARLTRVRTAADQVRARIQRNNRTAMVSVNRVLTPPQRTQLRAIVNERRRQQAAPAAGRETGAGGPD